MASGTEQGTPAKSATWNIKCSRSYVLLRPEVVGRARPNLSVQKGRFGRDNVMWIFLILFGTVFPSRVCWRGWTTRDGRGDSERPLSPLWWTGRDGVQTVAQGPSHRVSNRWMVPAGLGLEVMA